MKMVMKESSLEPRVGIRVNQMGGWSFPVDEGVVVTGRLNAKGNTAQKARKGSGFNRLNRCRGSSQLKPPERYRVFKRQNLLTA